MSKLLFLLIGLVSFNAFAEYKLVPFNMSYFVNRYDDNEQVQIGSKSGDLNFVLKNGYNDWDFSGKAEELFFNDNYVNFKTVLSVIGVQDGNHKCKGGKLFVVRAQTSMMKHGSQTSLGSLDTQTLICENSWGQLVYDNLVYLSDRPYRLTLYLNTTW